MERIDNTSSTLALIGGSGFIGTALARILSGGARHIRIIDLVPPKVEHRNTTYAQADITKSAQISEALKGTDRIINLAAAHRDNVRPISLYHETNVVGSQNICDAASTLGIQEILFTSSVAVYGLPKGVPDETTQPNPFNPYGETKWGAEKVYRHWQEEVAGRCVDVVRPTVVFGPGNRGNVYNLLAQLSHRYFVMIGDGTNVKSMAYVGNVAAFLAHLLGRDAQPGYYLYNYCDKPDLDMNQLVKLVREALGKNPRPVLRLPYQLAQAIGVAFDQVSQMTGRTFPISAVRVTKFCANTSFSSDKLRETKFVPPFELNAGLLETVRQEFL